MKCVRAYGWTQTYFVKYILLVPRNIYNTTEEHWKVEHELTSSHGFLAVTIAGVVTHALTHEWYHGGRHYSNFSVGGMVRPR